MAQDMMNTVTEISFFFFLISFLFYILRYQEHFLVYLIYSL